MLRKLKGFFSFRKLSDSTYQPEGYVMDDTGWFDWSGRFDGEEQEQFIFLERKKTLIRVLFFLFFFVLVFFGGYLIYITIQQGDTNLLIAQKNAQQTYRISSSRGGIYAQDGTVLATSQDAFHLIANPSQFQSEQEIREMTEMLVQHSIDVVYDDVYTRLIRAYDQGFGHITLIKNLTPEQVVDLSSFIETYPALSLQETQIRFYPYGETLSHLIGYTAEVSREDIIRNKEYALLDYIGKQGVEGKFESILQGVDGIFVKHTGARGGVEDERLVRNPEKGGDLVLTIDLTLQQIIYEELSKVVIDTTSEEEKDPPSGRILVPAATAVALDPRSGAVRAMVSLPDFNPNHFARGLNPEEVKIYFDASQNFFFNRATSGAYPSGSVIKPFVAVAALEEGVVDPSTAFRTRGYLEVQSIYNPDITWSFLDWKDHGVVRMKEALSMSSNVYFYIVGGGYKSIEGLGIERLEKWLREFYWGRSLGIDFDSESSGFLPTPAWKQEAKGASWYIGDTYNTSIGQGDVGVTPLQVATSVAALANGGTVYRPYVVEQVVYEDGTGNLYVPNVLHTDIASSQSLAVVQGGMREAVTTGLSSALNTLPVSFAGKTGTIQAGGGGHNHALSAVYGPYDDPDLVLVVLLERGRVSTQAVRATRDILQRYYQEVL